MLGFRQFVAYAKLTKLKEGEGFIHPKTRRAISAKGDDEDFGFNTNHNDIARRHGFADKYDVINKGGIRYDVGGGWSNYEFKHTPQNVKDVIHHLKHEVNPNDSVALDIHPPDAKLHVSYDYGKSKSHQFPSVKDALRHLHGMKFTKV